MSGHSKWATIRRKKGALDAKRGKVFTKLIRELSTAARLGGPDPAGNARLRLVVDKARAANMPKDNIERAIKRGSGASEGEVYEEVVYEGYGPGGTAILLEALTDNRNRTASEVRHTLTKYSGSLGSTGCVSYLFEKRGQILCEAGGFEGDALLEAALEAGAEDVQEQDGGFLVLTRAGQLHAVKEALERRGFRPADASVTMAPSTTVKLIGKDAEAMLHLSDALEDLDDIQGVYANYDISEEEMAKLA